MNILFEETVGEQSRRAAVMIGRLQPPHAGHYTVLDEIKKYIKDNPALRLDPIPILVIVDGKNTGKDKLRNPLSAHERVSFIQGSGRANGVKILISDSALEAFEAVRKAGFEPIAIAAGADRSNYVDMLNKYFRTATDGPIKHVAMSLARDPGTQTGKKVDKEKALDDILRYTDADIPVTMISGSLARLAVTKNELEKFSIIVGLSKKPKLAKMLFDKIKKAMTGDTNGAS